MKHKITQHDDGLVAWTEFECANCHADFDYIAADQVAVLEASADGEKFACPNCRDEREIYDLTFKEQQMK